VNPSEIQGILEDRGAILRGHFKLTSGRHSDLFFQKFRVLEHPRLAQRFGESIAEAFGRHFDVVASPAVGAVVLGFATALAADARFVFAEREGDEMRFRRGFELAPRERTLIVEDVITTGGSAYEVVDLVRKAGAEPVGVGVLIDRGDASKPTSFGVPVQSLLKLETTSWTPEECPLCAEGVPLEDPGSRRLKA
jgi:orotate phosphoribosyltransferase